MALTKAKRGSPAAQRARIRGAPTRPALRWFGGKFLVAPRIVSNFPPHRLYVEPYGGAASVLLHKNESVAEVYNDLDRDLWGLFTVLRDPERAQKLVSQLELTPYSRVEFERAYMECEDPIERARRLIILSFMGWGANAHCRRPTSFRASANRTGGTPAHDWANYPDGLRQIIERLRNVIVECSPALEVIVKHDRADTLFYVDPPYPWDTRSQKSPYDTKYRRYNFEMSDADHRRLLATLKRLKGMVVLSGYGSEMYEKALKGWRRVEMDTHADGGRDRVEVLWMNPAAATRLDKARGTATQLGMFDDLALPTARTSSG